MFPFISTAYKEKMKEISVLSLICSCLYPETRKNIMGDFEGKCKSDLSNVLEWKSYGANRGFLFVFFILSH